eukprot:762525-Hanusia_phi.AAC.1
MTCITPSHPPGYVSAVLLQTGLQAFSLKASFYFHSLIEVDHLIPSFGVMNIPSTLTVYGNAFLFISGYQCQIGKHSIQGNVLSKSHMRCSFPPLEAGRHSMQIKLKISTKSLGSTDFLVIKRPRIFSLHPSMATPETTILTVYGSNFQSDIHGQCILDHSVSEMKHTESSSMVLCILQLCIDKSKSIKVSLGGIESNSVEMVCFLPEIYTVNPSIQVRGGDLISVMGSRFWNSSWIEARFGKTIEPATFYSSSLILLHSPLIQQATTTLLQVYIDDVLVSNSVSISYMDEKFPAIHRLMPSSGPVKGSSFVTIFGSNMNETHLQVYFGSIATHPIERGFEQALFVLPPNREGNHPVQVFSRNKTISQAISFLYCSVPQIWYCRQNSYMFDGAQPLHITIIGQNFTPSCSLFCKAEGKQSTEGEILSSSHALCSMADLPRGNMTVFLFQNDGDYFLGSIQVQVYNLVRFIHPTKIPAIGGVLITVGLEKLAMERNNDIQLKIDNTRLKCKLIHDELLCSTPQCAEGLAVLEVKLHQEILIEKPLLCLEVVMPTIINFSPKILLSGGGQLVQLDGSGFTSGYDFLCQFDEIRVTATAYSSSTIGCISPPHMQGFAKLNVWLGASNLLQDEAFYAQQPRILNFYFYSKRELFIEAQELTASADWSCRFGGYLIVSATRVGPNSVTCLVPQFLIGNITIELSMNEIIFSEPKAIQLKQTTNEDKVFPSQGSINGGYHVTLYLIGRSRMVKNVFINRSIQPILEKKSNRIVCLVQPGMEPGTTQIQIEYFDNNNFESNLLFEYIPDLVADSLFPSAGPSRGSIEVAVRGEYIPLSGSVRCVFGDSEAAGLVVTSSYMRCITPLSRQVGTVPFSIKVGQTAIGTSLKYEFVEPPEILGMIPSQGPTDGGTKVLMYGS